jgi:hypothetical protein
MKMSSIRLAGVLTLTLVCSSTLEAAASPESSAGPGAPTPTEAPTRPAAPDHLAPPVSPASTPADRNDVPSCYHFAKLDQYADKPGPRELVIIIDKTTALSDELRLAARDAAEHFIHRGDEVLIYQFTAYLKTDFLRLPFRGRLEVDMPKGRRDSIGQEDLRVFDRCLAEQAAFFKTLFEVKFDDSTGRPTVNFDKSEILFSLKQIAADLQKRKVEHRVILLISDLLENSDFSNFYQNNQVRLLDPKLEIDRVRQKDLLADFDGAHIYIHGAGLIDPSEKRSYRSGVTIKALQSFWTDYFSLSNATVEAFGAPDMNVDMQ